MRIPQLTSNTNEFPPGRPGCVQLELRVKFFQRYIVSRENPWSSWRSPLGASRTAGQRSDTQGPALRDARRREIRARLRRIFGVAVRIKFSELLRELKDA